MDWRFYGDARILPVVALVMAYSIRLAAWARQARKKKRAAEAEKLKQEIRDLQNQIQDLKRETRGLDGLK